MKRLITTLLVLLLMVVPTFASDPFNQDQADRYNAAAEVYLTCVVKAAIPQIKKGFTASYGVGKGYEACVDDAVEIIGILGELEATEEQIDWAFANYFTETVRSLEKSINASALAREEYNKQQEPEKQPEKQPVPKKRGTGSGEKDFALS